MRRAKELRILRLEDRNVPATFGIPWTDPSHLTISFAPDQTTVTTGKSVLFQTLNSQQPTVVWQREILRALQTWAEVANVDIGVVSDNGAPFGSNSGSGPTRVTGDIRVSAVSMAPTSLAIGLPPDPFFGDYWSGEVVYNAANQLNPAQATLYSVIAHEFGHALGLPSSSDTASIMYNFATTPGTKLAPSDVTAIQALYGVRQPDRYDAEESNATFDRATNIEYHAGQFNGQIPLVAFGNVTSAGDVDTYRIETPNNYSGPVTFQLRSRGLSLLAPKLSVFDQDGDLLGLSLSTDPGGDTVTVHLNQSMPDTQYYLKVEGATTDVFGVGRFGVAVTFDSAVVPEYLNQLPGILTGPFDELDDDDLGELFTNPGQATFCDDYGTDDSLTTAAPLTSIAKLFETVGTIESANDVDVYRVRTPQQSTPVVLTLSLRAEAVNGGIPQIELVTNSGQVLPTNVLFNGDGRLTVQSSQLVANTDFFIRLRGSTTSQIGNYALTVLTGSTVVTPLTFASGTLFNTPQLQQLVVAQNQVFHFMLGVTGPTTSGVRMTVTGNQGLVYDLTVFGGSMANAKPILLKPGVYTVTFSPIGSANVMSYVLKGAVLSDPIGPAINDPTQNPAGPDSSLATYYFRRLKLLAGVISNSDSLSSS